MGTTAKTKKLGGIFWVTRLFPPLSAVEDLVWRDAEVREHLGDAAGVHATVGSHVLLAASVHVDLAHCG